MNMKIGLRLQKLFQENTQPINYAVFKKRRIAHKRILKNKCLKKKEKQNFLTNHDLKAKH